VSTARARRAVAPRIAAPRTINLTPRRESNRGEYRQWIDVFLRRPQMVEAMQIQREYGPRRVYETSRGGNGGKALRLSDRIVELGPREFDLYSRLITWLPTQEPEEAFCAQTGLDAAKLSALARKLNDAGLLYERRRIPESITGLELHHTFNRVLPSWLAEAFSHPFWERMTSGNGSRRLFTGWLIELYHYTKNANRHMPLSCAHTREKALKLLRAKHYAEEWNHYHYFTKALKALGLGNEAVATSVPLPMTLALSNFMRQAAREDVLAYSICSAVLEGTTTDRQQYNPYYEKCAEHYGLPREAIQPIYAHLDLDVQYQHSDLFRDILEKVDSIPAARAARILDYGHQLAEHIWMWTDDIEKYYGNELNPVTRKPFDPQLD
jgi:pyrroloquinoline quinone (PQQ) biosynthesis protein C